MFDYSSKSIPVPHKRYTRKESITLSFILITSIWAKTVDAAIFGLGITFVGKKMRENKRRRHDGKTSN